MAPDDFLLKRPSDFHLFSCAWIMTRQGMRLLVRNWQEKFQKDGESGFETIKKRLEQILL